MIESGADPNLPLGKGVGTALCSLTTSEAIKNHTLASSIAMVIGNNSTVHPFYVFSQVSYLLSHGANLLQPVVTREGFPPGCVTDFIYEVANEVIMQSLLSVN